MQDKLASQNLWMISFVDLIMLLITFFLLIYASGLKIDSEIEEAVKQQKTEKIFDEKLRFTNIIDLHYLESLLKSDIISEEIIITHSENSLIFKIDEKNLIDEYSNLSLSGKNILRKIDSYLADIGNKINIIYYINLEKKPLYASNSIYSSMEICSKIRSFLQKPENNDNILVSVNINYLSDISNISDINNFLKIIVNVR